MLQGTGDTLVRARSLRRSMSPPEILLWAAHDFGDRPTRDAVRDRWFASRNLATMRVRPAEIARDPDAVVRGIVALATERLGEE